MRLLGLDGSSLALALLASASALLLLYLQVRPARRVVVPSLSLWSPIADSRRRPSALLSRMRLMLSWLLALAIASALVLALSQPEFARDGADRDVVLVIDCSPSMNARDGVASRTGVASSRLETAKNLARQRVRELAEHDHAWIVALADGATPRTPRTRDKAALLHAIDRLHGLAQPAQLELAVELAIDLLAGRPAGELILFSDGALDERDAAQRALAAHPKLATQYVQVGQSARNVAITQLAARPYLLDHAHHEVLVSLQNFGGAAEPLRLTLSADTALLSQERLVLGPGGVLTRVLSDLPNGRTRLRAQLELEQGVDALPDDDQAETDLPATSRTRVLVVSSGNRYLEAALLLDDTLDVSEQTPGAYRSSAGFDLVIFDGVLPEQAPRTAALYFGASASEATSQAGFPLLRSGALVRPYVERVEPVHPLVRELALGDVNIARAVRLELAPGDRAVASTASHDPLIVEGRRDGQPFVAFAFDLRDSDLPLRAAFPLLFLRTLEHLRGASSGSLVSTAQLVPHEAALAPRPDVLGKLAQPRVHVARAHWLDSLWPALLGLALLLLIFEWFSFHRGWTA